MAQQLGQLRPFEMDKWVRVNDGPRLTWPREIREYALRLQEFNLAWRAVADYERWYGADIDRQDQKSARKLHELKESAQERFAGLESVIKSAQTVLDSFLLNV